MRKAKVYLDRVSILPVSCCLVGRPGLGEIVVLSRGALVWVTYSIVRRELKPLHHRHHLSWLLFGPYPWEVLELVLISMTSSSSSKTDSICILYCVFDIGGSFASLTSYFLLLIWLYPFEDLELVSISMTSSSSSKTDSICILYCVFDLEVLPGCLL